MNNGCTFLPLQSGANCKGDQRALGGYKVTNGMPRCSRAAQTSCLSTLGRRARAYPLRTSMARLSGMKQQLDLRTICRYNIPQPLFGVKVLRHHTWPQVHL